MDKQFLILIWLVVLCSSSGQVTGYKPVVLVHGIFSDGGELSGLKNMITQAHPGTKVIILKFFPNVMSMERLPLQLPIVEKKLMAIEEYYEDGIHLVCHSQGGMLCLGYLLVNPKHNVHSMVILSSPLFGQYGVPIDVLKALPFLKPIANLTRDLVTPIFLSRFFQEVLAIANYWKDPRLKYRHEYEQHSLYLPMILNDPMHYGYNCTVASERKANFLRLKKLVLVGGPDDGVIKPWQTTLFAYYDEDEKSIVSMFKQKVFVEDWFGLQTLYHRHAVSRFIFSGVHHKEWHSNKTVFYKAVLPSLT